MPGTPLDALFGAEGGGDFLTEEGKDVLFEATKAEAKPSSNGKPGLKVIAKVVGGPNEGKTITHQMFYSPESETALNILWRSLQALGITQEFATQVVQGLPDGSAPNQLFIEAAKVIPGRRFLADVAKDKNNTREEYRDRIKVQFALKPPPAETVAAPAPVAATPEAAPVPAAPEAPAAPAAPEVAVPEGDRPPF